MMVTVIIPNYNHEKFLEKRIESVLNQSYQNFEVIILDDCSTDNSYNILKKYASHPKIKQFVFNDKNSGSTFKQWDKGIELATGEWIWIAESDDYCEPFLLETLINNAHSFNNVVISYCQSVQVDERGDFIRTMHFHTDPVDSLRWNNDYYEYGLNEVSNFLIHRNTIPNASAVIFKRNAYNSISKSFTKMKLCGDWYLWIKLLFVGNISFSSQPLNYFRTHAATTRNDDSIYKIRSRLKEESAIINYLIDNNIGLNGVSQQKKANVIERYANTFKKKDLLKFIFKPENDVHKISKVGVLKFKLNRMFYRAGLID